MHNRIVGKPGKHAGLKRFVEYVKSHEGVCYDTRRDIAKHWMKQFPYEKVGPTVALQNSVTV